MHTSKASVHTYKASVHSQYLHCSWTDFSQNLNPALCKQNKHHKYHVMTTSYVSHASSPCVHARSLLVVLEICLWSNLDACKIWAKSDQWMLSNNGKNPVQWEATDRGHMTKYCALIGRKDDGGKDDLPGVGFFWESLDVEKYDKEAFSFLVTPPESAYEKNPRGGWSCQPKSTLCRRKGSVIKWIKVQHHTSIRWTPGSSPTHFSARSSMPSLSFWFFLFLIAENTAITCRG